MRLVGKINANPRVAQFVPDHDDWFHECATGMSFRDFELVARQWERLADVDGAGDRQGLGRELALDPLRILG